MSVFSSLGINVNTDQMVTFGAFQISSIIKVEYLCVYVYNEFMLLHVYEISCLNLI